MTSDHIHQQKCLIITLSRRTVQATDMTMSQIRSAHTRWPDGLLVLADKKVDVFEEGHEPEDVLPLLTQKAIRAAKKRGEEDTAEIQALIQHEVDFMQVSDTSQA